MPDKGWLSLTVSLADSEAGETPKPSFLISIPKKIVRLAVKRNRLKRLIRVAFREEAVLGKQRSYHFRVRRQPGELGLVETKRVIRFLLDQEKLL